ncbi:class I SAM-dependent methyltransferase [Microbacterium sp.]|jgi:SAM-dependent methyltransferase|uniref:class I SAM-dependent methyltransferase n=1 Tax=Microbacterium sp. TaxID=51671 RepID=UPI0037C96A1F
MTDQAPVEFWEQRYAGSPRVWSGRVNGTLAAVTDALAPGRAMDLGCGEGGDVLWLAARGWHATGVDLSPTAVQRARTAADARGLSDRTRFIAADLSSYTDGDEYDLVTASFLQSPVELPRELILRTATGFVSPGGSILVVGHAAAPPWAPTDHVHDMVFPTPEGDLAALQLDDARWRTLVVEVRERTATSPDGAHTVLHDSVVLAQRVD